MKMFDKEHIVIPTYGNQILFWLLADFYNIAIFCYNCQARVETAAAEQHVGPLGTSTLHP